MYYDSHSKQPTSKVEPRKVFFRKKGQNPSMLGGREDFLQRSDPDDDPGKRQ